MFLILCAVYFFFPGKLSCVVPSDGQHLLLKSNPSYMYKHLLPVIPSFEESADYETMPS